MHKRLPLARRDICRLAHPIYVVRQNLLFFFSLTLTIASGENLSKSNYLPRCLVEQKSVAILNPLSNRNPMQKPSFHVNFWVDVYLIFPSFASSTSGSREPGRLSDVKTSVRVHDSLSTPRLNFKRAVTSQWRGNVDSSRKQTYQYFDKNCIALNKYKGLS